MQPLSDLKFARLVGLLAVAAACFCNPAISPAQNKNKVAPPSADHIRQQAQVQRVIEDEAYFNEHLTRADIVATATVGSPIEEVEGEYPNGETESMLSVPLTLTQVHKGGPHSKTLTAFLNLSRPRLDPGRVAVVQQKLQAGMR